MMDLMIIILIIFILIAFGIFISTCLRIIRCKGLLSNVNFKKGDIDEYKKLSLLPALGLVLFVGFWIVIIGFVYVISISEPYVQDFNFGYWVVIFFPGCVLIAILLSIKRNYDKPLTKE